MLVAGVALTGLISGCATKENVASGTRYVINVPKAPFYKYGPAQSFGADFVLIKGQKVMLVDRSYGFSRVMTEDGISGWVANDELSPAPVEVTPPPSRLASNLKNSKKERTYSGPRKNSHVEPVPGDPLFDMSDLPPPPLPENPEPKPQFRNSPPKPK